MKPSTCRRLHHADVELGEIIDRYTEALRRLEVDVTPGFPSKTPGNGDPPGGSGGHGDSVTERIAGRHHPELRDLSLLHDLPTRLVSAAHRLLVDVGHVGAALTPVHLAELGVMRRLVWCRWAVRQLVARPDVVDEPPHEDLRALVDLVSDARLVTRMWGYTPVEPATPRTQRDELAHDPTDMLCRSCLRVGRRSDRYRGDLCQWCYRFQRSEGFVPPPDIVEARAAGKQITEAMVAACRRAPSKRRRRR